MKHFANGIIFGIIVVMPAVGFCFPGSSGQKKEKPSSPAMEVADPLAAGMGAEPEQAGPTVSGKVFETMDGGGYTYIHLEKKDGSLQWFAIPVTPVKVGQEVEITKGMAMGKFTSRALNRTFDDINFSGGLVVKQDDEAIKKKAHAGIVKEEKGGPVEPPEKVEKASGANGYTVAEVYAKKAELAGKSVAVRGKVVKVSAGIMGKNWVHLRDGSGDAAKGTHNLIVTTQDLPATGDIVTATGDFMVDKDFGSGYKYDAIMENAAIKK